MARLKAPVLAGFNAGYGGKTIVAKMMRIEEIIVDPEISGIFRINEKMLEEVHQKMLNNGFDISQPAVIQKDTNILLDGHTRRAAALKAGLFEIPVVEKEFKSRDEAIMYTFERQVIRRNLTGAEIFTAAKILPVRKDKDGTGRAAEHLAKKLNTGVTTIYQARAIAKSEDEEIIQSVQNGDMTIKDGYNKLASKKTASKPKPEKPDVEFTVTNSYGLPENIKFLKAAIILLADNKQLLSAQLLMNHFLEKHEKNGFIKILPESVQSTIATPV